MIIWLSLSRDSNGIEVGKIADGDGKALGVRIRYSFDGPKLLGTGGARIRLYSKREKLFDMRIHFRKGIHDPSRNSWTNWGALTTNSRVSLTAPFVFGTKNELKSSRM